MQKINTRTLKKIGALLSCATTIFLVSGFLSACPISKNNTTAMPDTVLLQLAGQFLYKVKLNEPTTELEKQLAALDYNQLKNGLNNDNAIKSFWLNMYNGWFQVLAVREKLTRPAIFSSKVITIASKKFSLDQIEHGILRKYRWKFSKGYLPSFFPGKTIKQLAVDTIDYRIHFALNCGAKSCPPIAFYTYDKMDPQLDLAARVFLKNETEIDTVHKVVRVTKIMDWFAGDFGGKKGIRRIIRTFLQKNIDGYRITYKPYNWDEVLHNFSE